MADQPVHPILRELARFLARQAAREATESSVAPGGQPSPRGQQSKKVRKDTRLAHKRSNVATAVADKENVDD